MKTSKNTKNYKKRIATSTHAGMASGVSKFRHSYRSMKRMISFSLALILVLGLVYVGGMMSKVKAADGTLSFADGTWAEDTETSAVTDNDFMNTLSDRTADTTIVVPVTNLVLGTADKHVLNSDFYECAFWSKDALPEGWAPTIDASTGDVSDYVVAAISSIDCATDDAVYLHKFNISKNGESQWVLDASSVSSVKFTIQCTAPSAPTVSKADFVYSISDVADSENTVYYGSFGYSVKSTSATSLTAFDRSESATDTAATAAATLSADGNDKDGTYLITKKITTTDSSKTFIYGWSGLYTRDDNIGDCSFKLLDSEDVESVGPFDPTKEVKLVATGNSTETINVKITISDDQGSKEGTLDSSTTEISTAMPSGVDTVNSRSGKSFEATAVFSAEGKKDITITKTISYEDVIPTVTITGVDGAVDVDGTQYVNGTSVALRVDFAAGGSGTSARISSDKISVTSAATYSESDSDSFTNVASNSNTKVVIKDFPADDTFTVLVNITNDKGIKATDASVMLNVDNTAPELTVKSVSQAGNTYTPAAGNADITVPDTYKFTSAKDVEIVFHLSDGENGSGLKTKTAKWGSTEYTLEDIGSGDYKITIPADPSNKGAAPSIDLAAEDNVGLTTAVKVNYQYVQDNITISGGDISSNGGTSYDKDGNAKTLDDNFYDGKVKIVYTVDSDIELNAASAVLTATKGGETGPLTTKTGPEIASAGENKYTVTYTLEETGKKAFKYDNIDFVISNTNGYASPKYTITILKVDLTNPYAGISIDTDPTKTVQNADADAGWYKTLWLLINYSDTDSSGVESGIASVTVTNVEGVTSKNITLNSSGVTGVQVNKSTDTSGTPVKVTAVDNIGNKFESETETFKVDPEFSGDVKLKVTTDGTEVSGSGNKYKGEPKINITAVDDIEVKDITVKVEQNGTAVADYHLSDTSFGTKSVDKTVDLSAVLTAAGKTLDDGSYTINSTAMDIAGNKKAATPEVKFVLDNLPPSFGNAVITQIDKKSDTHSETKDISDNNTEQVSFDNSVSRKSEVSFAISGVADAAFNPSAGEGSISITAPDGSAVTGYTYDKAAGNLSFKVDPASYTAGEGTFTITLTDAAGNANTRKLKVKFLEDKLTVTYAVTGFDEIAEGEYQGKSSSTDIKFTIESDSPVKPEDIAIKVGGTAVTFDASKFTAVTEADGNYKYTYVQSVSGTDTKINDTSFEATNIFGISDSKEITIIGFDLSNPDIKEDVSPESEGKGTVDGTAGIPDWYQNLVLYVTYDDTKDGPLSWDSGIKKISVTGATPMFDSETYSNLAAYISANPHKGSFYVDVDESSVAAAEFGDGAIYPTEVRFEIEDNVGHKKSIMNTYKVDKEDPTSGLWISEIPFGEGTWIESADATEENTIFGNGTQDIQIAYNVKDNIRAHMSLNVLGPVNATLNPDNRTFFNQNMKFSELLGSAVQDGEYTIRLGAFDMSGRKPDPYIRKMTVRFDNTLPDIKDITVAQYGNTAIKKVGKDYYQLTASETSPSHGAFTISFDADDPKVNSYASGLAGANSIIVNETIDGDTKTVANMVNSGNKQVDIFTDSSYAGKQVTYQIVVIDAAGNSTSETFTVAFIKDEISIKHRTVSQNQKTGTFDIVYDIVSDAPITPDEDASNLNDGNITLTMDTVDGAKDKSNAGTGVLKKADTYDASKAVYNYTYTYSINKSQSDKLENISVSVKNNNNVVSDVDSIDFINIDLFDPQIAASGLPGDAETKWHKNLKISLDYTEGDREYMSGVASIMVSGVKQAVAGNSYRLTFGDDERELNGTLLADVNESTGLGGTPVDVVIEDKFGRSTTMHYTFHVDETDPEAAFTVNGIDWDDVDGAYLGGEPANPTVSYSAKDNIQLQNYALTITLPSGAKVTPASGTNTNNIGNDTTLADLIGAANCVNGVPRDGEYTIVLSVTDLAGRTAADDVEATFTVDNTSPRNDLIITSERPAKFDKYNSSYSNSYTGTSYDYGQYYANDVYFDAVVTDSNVDEFTVSDNGYVIYSGSSEGTYNLGVSSEGEHNIVISTVDKTGLRAESQSISFTIDKSAPDVSTALNGSGFLDESGLRYLNTSGDVSVSVSDANVDEDDLTMTVITTPPNSGSSTSETKVQPGTQSFAQDAEYTVRFIAVDRAGNRSAERSVSFRVDKTPPELRFTGAADKGTATSSVTVNYIVNEAFYSDMNGCTLRVYRKIDGQGESLLKTVEIRPTGPQYSLSELFQEDGEYRFEMSAEDKCGNKSQASYTFILDGKAPIITLTGVGNYDKTVEDVILGITVDETFFTSNKVVLSGTRIDIDGKKNKVEFDGFNPNASKVTTFEQVFKEDGIYDISIESTDKAGNKTTRKLHFTIDRTDPEIIGIDDYDGKAVKSFNWNVDMDSLVKDLTVCNTYVYMDGVEYDGTTTLKDGTHLLRVVSTDELGHTTEKEVSFRLDTTVPNILVMGVEEGQYINVPTDVQVGVELDDDKLTKVTLNGVEVPIKDGVATVRVDKRMSYTLLAEAVDDAGNVSKIELHFNFGEKFPWWIFIAGAGGLGLIFLIIAISRKKQNKK